MTLRKSKSDSRFLQKNYEINWRLMCSIPLDIEVRLIKSLRRYDNIRSFDFMGRSCNIWSNRMDVFQARYVYIPINHTDGGIGGHWSLCVVDIQRKVGTYILLVGGRCLSNIVQRVDVSLFTHIYCRFYILRVVQNRLIKDYIFVKPVR